MDASGCCSISNACCRRRTSVRCPASLNCNSIDPTLGGRPTMTDTSSLLRRVCGAPLVAASLLLGVLVSVPRVPFAQDASKQYAIADLSTPVQLQSPSDAARSIQKAYPRNLLRAGIGGTVQLEF